MIRLRDIITEAAQPQFEPVKLGRKFNEYEPHFDEETMRTHYNKHYKGYIEKLNKAIELTNQILFLNVPLGISIDIGKNYAEAH